jgi:hypothetical protein
VADLIGQGLPRQHRSDMVPEYLACLERVDTKNQPTPEQVCEIYGKGIAS